VSNVSDLFDVADDGVIVRVHVVPGAGRTAVVGRHGDALKVRVAAPPLEGRANEAAGALVAETLGVGAASVELSAGEKSRAKRFKIGGIEAEDAETRLQAALDEADSQVGRPRRRPS
jgi:uncharacterized protein (TIGR00251 family)